MKSITKTIVTIILSVVIISSVCSCKRDPGPSIMDTAEVKEQCIKAGDDFMDALAVLDYESIARLSSDDMQESYLASANQFQSYITNDDYSNRNATGWQRETLDYMFSQFNHISGTFERIDDTTAVVKYVFATAMYTDGSLSESYEVELTFSIDNEAEAVYLTNPELSLELYHQIINNYAVHFLDVNRTMQMVDQALAAQAAEAAAQEPEPQPDPVPEVIPEPEAVPEEVPEETEG